MNDELYKKFNRLTFSFFYPAVLGFMLIEFFNLKQNFSIVKTLIAFLAFAYFCTQYLEVDDPQAIHNNDKKCKTWGRIILNWAEGGIFLFLSYVLFSTTTDYDSKFDCLCTINCKDPQIALAYILLTLAFIVPLIRRCFFSRDIKNMEEGKSCKERARYNFVKAVLEADKPYHCCLTILALAAAIFSGIGATSFQYVYIPPILIALCLVCYAIIIVKRTTDI